MKRVSLAGLGTLVLLAAKSGNNEHSSEKDQLLKNEPCCVETVCCKGRENATLLLTGR